MYNNVKDKEIFRNCTGCGACAATCPVDAIKFKINDNGFYAPYIDEEKCIKCGKCKRVCVKYLKNEELGKKIETGKVYSAQSTNLKTVETCTSGGIAYEISKYGIEKGYKILGTIYDYKENIAKAVIVDKLEDLEKLKGSKYIQSNTKVAFRELLELARKNSDYKFIVFGTPCQLAGVSKLIEDNKIKNEIIKVELFCHGVPSYLVWKKYIDMLKKKHNINNIENINFRDKTKGWHKYYINIKGNDLSYINNSDNDIFYKAFLDDVLLNTSCQTCEFRKNYSMADIRLGDYWGNRYLNREDGVSAILVLNEIGEELINKIKSENRIKIIEETPTEECINAQSRKDYKYQYLRENAFEELKTDKELKNVIKGYRQKMPLKRKIKYTLKGFSRILPKTIRNNLKKIIKKA